MSFISCFQLEWYYIIKWVVNVWRKNMKIAHVESCKNVSSLKNLQQWDDERDKPLNCSMYSLSSWESCLSPLRNSLRRGNHFMFCKLSEKVEKTPSIDGCCTVIGWIWYLGGRGRYRAPFSAKNKTIKKTKEKVERSAKQPAGASTSLSANSQHQQE